MNRKLLEDLHDYFAQKSERNGAEHHMMCELKDELNWFRVTSVHRDDLERLGFDTTDVDDCDMKDIARRLEDDYCEQLFHQSLEIIADQGLDIPKHVCPKCGERADRYCSEENMLSCYSCDHTWHKEEPTGRYVKVEHPEDTTFYENCEVGYECYNSHDNGAMYVPEHFYKAHESKEPNPTSIYSPVMWPDSQEYFELEHTSESDFEKCEVINHGKAFNDFNSQTIWVPLSLMQKQ